MIVIDVGCARYGGDYSIERLIEEFKPDLLYGFDPAWEGPPPEHNGCRVIVSRMAAWTHGGRIGFTIDGLSGHIDQAADPVKCFDLAVFIATLPTNREIALKIDAEGAEYDLLEHLIETTAAQRLKLVWVEWHPPGAAVNSLPDERRAQIESRLACEVHQWNW